MEPSPKPYFTHHFAAACASQNKYSTRLFTFRIFFKLLCAVPKPTAQLHLLPRSVFGIAAQVWI
jgi:hypothetical protein